NLPHMNGIDCTRIIKEKMPDVQIIMQTVYENTEMIFESLKAGASGYLLKRTPPVKVLEAIEDVFKGGSPMSSQIARMVVESFHQKIEVPEGNLTTREEEILTLLSKGFKYREISESLFISMDTVRTHIRHIYEKLHVRSRTEAVIKFLKR
ncbi:MAG: response regulator transcription factor, partial [Ignavibacteriales bacterium]|nr:response regulator transcription factor [Ignavibacteriales bacterium]